MNEVVTVRPSNLSIAPLFQSSVSESPSNIFMQTVTAQSADARRMSFVWRSPGAGLLLNPSAHIQFQVKVTVPHNFSKAINAGPINARQNVGDPGDDFAGLGTHVQQVCGAGLALGSGNAVMNAVESIQYVINGGSISHANWNLFKRSLDSCYIPAKVAQRCFSQAGGSFLRFDEVSISSSSNCALGGGAQLADNGTLAAVQGVKFSAGVGSAGITMDSGLQQRLRNFSDCIVKQDFPTPSNPVSGKKTDTKLGVELTLRIQAPLDGGIFNQVYGEAGLARSSPYGKLCLAIPNVNSAAITILYKDLEKQLVRRLGRTWAVGDSTIAAGGAATAIPFKVEFDSSYDCRLHLIYIRLQSFRRMPEAVSLATYRTQTYIQDMPKPKTNVLVQRPNYSPGYSGVYLLPSGPDAYDCVDSVAYCAMDKAREWDCNFQNLQFAQPPSYLFFCAQKMTEAMTHVQHQDTEEAEFTLNMADSNATGIGDDPVAASAEKKYKVLAWNKHIAQNQDSNLAICRFRLYIQSSVGTFEMSADNVMPYLQDQRELFAVHKRNCCQSYLEDAGMSEWNSRASCFLVSVSEYLHGLGTSSGTSFPIQITANIIFQNRCTFVSGLKYSDARGAGPLLNRDYIAARAVVCGIFDKQVLQIASSSSVLSAQNFTAATTSSLLAGRS